MVVLQLCHSYGIIVLLSYLSYLTHVQGNRASWANAVLFVKGRIKFYHVSGIQGGTPSAPSVFIAYGKENAEALKNSGIEGKYLEFK